MEPDGELDVKPSSGKVVTVNDVRRQGGRYNFPGSKQEVRVNEKDSRVMEKGEEVKTPTKDEAPVIVAKNEAHKPSNSTYSDDGYYKSYFKLACLMSRNIDSSSVDKLQGIVMNKEMSSAVGGKKMNCGKCGGFKLKFKGSCGHSSCFYCIRKKIVDYVERPCLRLFKDLRCKYCFEVPSRVDLSLLFPMPDKTSLDYSNVKLVQKCLWCSRELDVATEYLPELNCLHLCRECYTDQIFMGIDSCMVCKSKFTNSNLTKFRTCTCKACGYTSNLLSMSYKSYSENSLICYSCQMKFMIDQNYSNLFNSLSLVKGKNLFVYFNNKTCPVCLKVNCLDSIKVCKKCGNFKCEDCYSYNSTCNFCEVRST